MLVNNLTRQVISPPIALIFLPRKHFLYRENLFHVSFLLVVCPWCPLACGCVTPISAYVFNGHLRCVCVSDFALLS